LKQIFALPVLLMLLCPVSAHADTGITGPSFTAGYDRIHIPAFQLSINDEPPFACSLIRGAVSHSTARRIFAFVTEAGNSPTPMRLARGNQPENKTRGLACRGVREPCRPRRSAVNRRGMSNGGPNKYSTERNPLLQ